MNISHKQLKDLDEARLVSILEPILDSHRLDAVELVWRGDPTGRVLELTLEVPGSTRSGEGITIEICSAISRALGVALDETSLIAGKYRLEVGSPGIERALYTLNDFKRFAGQQIKVKLNDPMGEEGFVGQKTVAGKLVGVANDSEILVSSDLGQVSLTLDRISSARLVFSWNQSAKKTMRPKSPLNAGAKAQKKDREQ